MIACLGKNDRGAPLFRELARLDPRYVDLGTIFPRPSAHIAGLIYSAGPNLAGIRREARFSPSFTTGLTNACVERLQEKEVSEVLYWGATNLPVDPDSGVPFSIVTDGPFDPSDATYPVEWRPKRWSTHYLAQQREVFRRAKHVFTLSEWARRKVIGVHGLAAEKVTKCGWGSLSCFYPPRLEPRGGTKLVVSVGSDWGRKGMDIVAEAGALLHSEDPRVETVIAGIPGGLSLTKYPGVSLLPTDVPSSVVHTLLYAATCLVVGSRFDASPHIIYEALQYGTPVVGTNVCGIPEAVDAPFGGALATASDVSSLLVALRGLLADDEAERRRGAYDAFLRSGGWRRAAEIIRERLEQESVSRLGSEYLSDFLTREPD